MSYLFLQFKERLVGALLFCRPTKGGTHTFFSVSPEIAQTQILGLIPQSHVRKKLRCASKQIANPHIRNDSSANRNFANFLVSQSANRNSEINKDCMCRFSEVYHPQKIIGSKSQIHKSPTYRVRKSQIRKFPHLRKVHKYKKI
jgi:hypothetical protein